MAADGDLRGRVAVVTGAAVGIGAAYREALLREGAYVAACDLRADITELGRDNLLTSVCDVRDAGAVARFVASAVERFGRIDILANNAGVWRQSEATDNLDKTIEDYDVVVGTNFAGEFLVGRAVIPHLIAAGGGDIVNVATDHMVTCGTPWDVCPRGPNCPFDRDSGGFSGPPRPTGGGPAMDLYDISKWALAGLTYSWTRALAPHGIRVNALCMGATDSHMLRGFHNNSPSPKEEATWMRTADAATVLIDLLKEGPNGRTGSMMNYCIGRPCRLEPEQEAIYLTDGKHS